MADITLEQFMELKAELTTLTAEVSQIRTSIIQWVVGLFIGTIVVIMSGLGVYTGVLTHLQ